MMEREDTGANRLSIRRSHARKPARRGGIRSQSFSSGIAEAGPAGCKAVLAGAVKPSLTRGGSQEECTDTSVVAAASKYDNLM